MDRLHRIALIGTIAACPGCHTIGGLSGLEFRDDAGVGGSATGTGSGAGGGGAQGAGGSDGGAGGSATLTDGGLVVRYHLDEASAGVVDEVDDAASDPLPLSVTAFSALSFTEVDGHRGLAWSAAGADDRLSAPIDGTKIAQRLDGATTATIEVVLEMREAVSGGSRISHIGQDIERGHLTLRSADAQLVELALNEQGAAEWDVGFATRGRLVLHCVIDTDAAQDTDRTVLYVDGVRQTPTGGTPPPVGTTIDLGTGRHYVLGNREVGGRSFVGELYYAALYDQALEDDRVASHAAALLASDDR